MRHENLRIHPEATEEITEAIAWYGARSDTAAAGFIEAVESAISEVLADPNRFASYMDGARGIRVKRYPFIIVYRALGATVQVIAVAHTSRRPGYWQHRRFEAEEP